MDLDNEKYPLVSILISSYNRPDFIQIALNSALQQTYKNIEIIICDDSTNDEVKKMIQPYLEKYKSVKYYNNGGPLGNYGAKNSNKCLSLASGEYINYLNDDDIFYPKKVELMVEYLKDKDIMLVTSHRNLIDSKGRVLPDNEVTVTITNKNSVYDGKEIGARMLRTRRNFIGEPTAVLFRKKDIEGYGVFMGRQYQCIPDMAMWLTLLQKGNCAYIVDTLCAIRKHGGRSIFNQKLRKIGLAEMKHLLEDGRKAGFI
ncbi:glycosyltransferase family 2 protein [Clostridium magnum]|uniref:Spore coat polysaccharide biosynthesis protein SpsA n=1 Tax=Clostridium magnum DSM 2767 TaxID=1121326 RepID=A0A161XGG9_9CLOT|nr:glycosyltransferase family 2 protein [Clostridium magnum]KZL93696.1 spore coat polysaccharide biosynthesis protein SpsA [Clostridium magnum DSM 2767]SHI10138.1 Glycosyl transferase family 2 [Clostridium magnum DSM 2767]